MATQGTQAATNERILRLVQEVQAELADSKKREQQGRPVVDRARRVHLSC